MKKLSSKSETVKAIVNKKFKLSLMQRETGAFYVSTEKAHSFLCVDSSDFYDYKIASSVFDNIFNQLEGN